MNFVKTHFPEDRMNLQIGIFLGLLVPICITALVIIIKEYYRIPDLKNLQQILDESDIDSILIATKFQRCTLIEIHKPLAKRLKIPEPVVPHKPKPFVMLNSKLVGRFYSIDQDDGTVHAQEGQTVKTGDMVGYIFSLQLKNEVYAETDGVIKKILIPDCGIAEFNQAIMQIEIE